MGTELDEGEENRGIAKHNDSWSFAPDPRKSSMLDGEQKSNI